MDVSRGADNFWELKVCVGESGELCLLTLLDEEVGQSQHDGVSAVQKVSTHQMGTSQRQTWTQQTELHAKYSEVGSRQKGTIRVQQKVSCRNNLLLIKLKKLILSRQHTDWFVKPQAFYTGNNYHDNETEPVVMINQTINPGSVTHRTSYLFTMSSVYNNNNKHLCSFEFSQRPLVPHVN